MKTFVRAAGSLALVAFVAWRLDWATFASAFAGMDYVLWGASVAVYVAAQFVSALRWRLLSAPLGFDLPYRRYVSLYFVGMFFNLVLPTSVGGDVVRAGYLAWGTRRRGGAVLSVLADRGTGLVLLVVMACVAGLFVQHVMPPWMAATLLGLAGAMLAGAVCVPLVPRVARWRLLGKRGPQLAMAAEVYGRRPGLLVVAAGLSVLVQAASVAQVAFVAAALGLDVSWAYLAVVVPLVTLLTLVPVSVNGMGLREVGLVVLLAPAGITAASAVSLSLAGFAATVAASLLGAVFYLGGACPRPGSIAAEGPSDAQAVRRHPDQGRAGQPAQAA